MIHNIFINDKPFSVNLLTYQETYDEILNKIEIKSDKEIIAQFHSYQKTTINGIDYFFKKEKLPLVFDKVNYLFYEDNVNFLVYRFLLSPILPFLNIYLIFFYFCLNSYFKNKKHVSFDGNIFLFQFFIFTISVLSSISYFKSDFFSFFSILNFSLIFFSAASVFFKEKLTYINLANYKVLNFSLSSDVVYKNIEDLIKDIPSQLPLDAKDNLNFSFSNQLLSDTNENIISNTN